MGSDVQYTSWLTEMADTGSYSGWAEVATRFMDGWRIQIETRDYPGLKFTNIVVGVQIEQSTVGPLETTDAVGGGVTTSWSDWAYNANKNNGKIDAVQIYVTADFAVETSDPTGAPTTEPTSEPTRNCDLLDIDEFLTDCSVEWDNAGNVMSTMATSIETNAASITAGATAIESNAASIGSNAASIASNVASIQSNAESIGSNTESIAVGATSIASNTESIGKNPAAIASNAAAIQSNAALENRIAALEHIMDQLDVNHAAAKYAPGNVDVVAPVSGMSDGINLTVKDLGIVLLMAMNMVMIVIMVITCKRQSGRRKYQVVSVGSDIEPINA